MDTSRADKPYRVCFVCTGNICRSPMAAVVLEHLVAKAGLSGEIEVDSAGTGPWHVGEQMDRRARAALARQGYDGSRHRAKRIEREWVRERELLVALDHSHAHYLERLRGPAAAPPVRLLRELDPAVTGSGDHLDVPDPYYGTAREFSDCLAMIEAAAAGMMDALAGRSGRRLR